MAADKLISSGSPWEASIGYSRATVAGDYVHVSGSTASIGGAVQHEGDAYGQTLVALNDVIMVFAFAPLVALLLGWEALVRIAQIPHYTLPAPSLVLQTLAANFGSLAGSWWFTLKITFGALALACTGGVLIASVFALSRAAEAALFPIAVVLQVTPIVAIAPLILIYVESTTAALLLCATLTAVSRVFTRN